VVDVTIIPAEQRSMESGAAGSALRERAAGVARGDRQGVRVLRDRPDSATMRVAGPDGSIVIMKFWDRSGPAFLLRRATRTSPAWREWRVSERLWHAGVAVPRPLGRYTLGSSGGRFGEALVTEDLGEVRTAIEALKDAIAAGRHAEAEAIETGVVSLTAGVVRAGVVDPDHSMYNIVQVPGGTLARLDFELARECAAPASRPALYADMLARTVGSFVFAVQPDGARAARFASRLAAELGAPPGVLRRARAGVEQMMERQREKKGIQVSVPLDW
jgi:serine/threonine-protein kinase RIO1